MSIRDHLSKYKKTLTPDYKADVVIRVSKDGADGAFRTIEQALEELKRVRSESPEKSVAVKLSAGEYLTDGLRVSSDMGGTEEAPVVIFADGDAVISCGTKLDKSGFKKIDGDVAARLCPEARENVLVCDLKSYGLCADDWGEIYPIGVAQTTELYPGKKKGTTSELFINDRRMTLARYPNGDDLGIEDVIREGFVPADQFGVRRECSNPDTGCYYVGEDVGRRMKNWRDADDVWICGYFRYDWAESSTRVKLNAEECTVTPELVSRFGVKKDAPYWFFNVFEELDEPGEWYLDRENGLLYVWPAVPLDEAEIVFSYKKAPVINIDNASNIILDGLKIRHTLSSGIKAYGNGIKIKRCNISCVAENGVEINGYSNAVSECDVHHTGRGGVFVKSGDRPTLTAGNSVVENNLIHDYEQVWLTYFPGVDMRGVGNICRHNEIFNAPHSAILYGGNDHTIEYNYIHDTVQRSNDAGAIYCGRNWTEHGTVIRYNVIENSGGGKYKPCAIYWDDGVSGQTAYSNLILHTGDNGIKFGGGRELTARYNIIYDAGEPFQYDDRMRVATEENGWTKSIAGDHSAVMWQRLYEMPYKSGRWAEKYPLVARIVDDLSDHDNPDLALNPAYSVVEKNVIICDGGATDMICDDVYKFSKIENNPRFETGTDVGFVNDADGDFRLREDSAIKKEISDFPDIPYEKIGRY